VLKVHSGKLLGHPGSVHGAAIVASDREPGELVSVAVVVVFVHAQQSAST